MYMYMHDTAVTFRKSLYSFFSSTLTDKYDDALLHKRKYIVVLITGTSVLYPKRARAIYQCFSS